jgi:hypothetical protein
MKRRFLVLVSLVTLSTLFAVTNASAAAAAWEVGVKAGATSATLHGNVSNWVSLPRFDILTDLKESRNGFAGGVYVNVRTSPMFSVQVEALYTQKGGSGTAAIRRNSVDFVGTDVTIELDYIEFPILLMATFPAGPVGVNGYGGISVGYNSSSKAVVEAPGISDSIDIGAFVTGVDLSAVFGLGVSFGVASVNIIADGRFEYSLKNINSAGTGQITNGVFYFMAGVAIPAGF